MGETANWTSRISRLDPKTFFPFKIAVDDNINVTGDIEDVTNEPPLYYTVKCKNKSVVDAGYIYVEFSGDNN